MKNFILPIIAVGSLAFASTTLVKHMPQRDSTAPPAPPPESPFAERVAAVGLVEASTENVAIGTPIAGIVERISVSSGQHVRVGDELFQIDSRQLRAQAELQRAGLKVAESELADLEVQRARSERLAPQKAISTEELDRRRFAVSTAEARVLQARAAIAASETEIARSRIAAPVDGVILKLNLHTGEYATAGVMPDPLLLIGGVEPMHVRVDVDEQEAWRVESGAKAVAAVRGNPSRKADLEFVRFEPYVIPKRSLTGASDERVDTRVLQIIYRVVPTGFPVHIGQQMDVFIDASSGDAVTIKHPDEKLQVNGGDARNGRVFR